MKPEELMIGDLVMHGFGGIGKITEIDSKTVVIKDDGFDTGDGMNEVSFALNELKPIPVTAETLEKNGFYYENNVGHVLEHYDYEIIYNMWGHELRILENRKQILNLEYFDKMYVHELQHALRLCGINKEIEI